jgi:adenylate cyclase
MTRFYLVSLFGHTGRHDEARKLWRELLDVKPDFSVNHYGRVLPYRDPATFGWFVDGVKAPGIEIQ